MEHKFRKKLNAKKKDDDWAPGKSRRAGYYDSNVNERGNKKELFGVKFHPELMPIESCYR